MAIWDSWFGWIYLLEIFCISGSFASFMQTLMQYQLVWTFNLFLRIMASNQCLFWTPDLVVNLPQVVRNDRDSSAGFKAVIIANHGSAAGSDCFELRKNCGRMHLNVPNAKANGSYRKNFKTIR
jgi:hypothetical protein